MTKNSPLRRLSVALKLRQAFDPPQPVTSADAPSISQFLRAAKDSFLKDVKEDPAKAAGQWTVVMGNEAGDLDSIASSIAYAWVLSEVKKIPAIPLVQVQHDDLNLRPENIYAFKLAGLTESLEELLTSSDVSEFKPFPSQKFALVDHNRLGSTFSLDNPTAEVVSVIDHHEDEKLYLNASPRIIAPCGSCASHVATQFPPEPLPDLALLLLTAILIDTDGLKPGGKAVQTDRDSALFLAPKSSIANSIPPLSALSPIDHPNPDALYEAQAIKDLTKALRDRKSDVSHLSGFDLLRRDYKEYSHTLPAHHRLKLASQPSFLALRHGVQMVNWNKPLSDG
jgi:exopolyphosphatase